MKCARENVLMYVRCVLIKSVWCVCTYVCACTMYYNRMNMWQQKQKTWTFATCSFSLHFHSLQLLCKRPALAGQFTLKWFECSLRREGWVGQPFYHRLSCEWILYSHKYIAIYIFFSHTVYAYSSVYVRHRLLTVHLAYSLIELFEIQ